VSKSFRFAGYACGAGELPGRVRLLFQPSEEQVPSGAPVVIAEGGLKDVESIFALHCYPHLPAGYVALRTGPITAAGDKIDIRLTGPGGHTARPHLTVDLAYALGRIVVEVPALLSRRLAPRAAASLQRSLPRTAKSPKASWSVRPRCWSSTTAPTCTRDRPRSSM
jgi:amidohydrolase